MGQIQKRQIEERKKKGRKEQESADRIACSRLKKYYVGEYKYAVMKN